MNMKFSTFKSFLNDALRSIKRNRTISIASAATVAASLFVLGVFLLTLLNVNNQVERLGSQLEIAIYLKNDITVSQQSAIEAELNGMNEVKNVKFVNKDEAFNELKQQFGDKDKEVLEGFDKNTLPLSYKVEVKSPELISKVVKKMKGMGGIDEIKDSKQIVDKLIAISHTVDIVGLTIFLILAGVSLFLISNTIKITVFSRRREVNIMKYIGATDWFVRWPFIIEGVIIGIIGSLISSIILFFAYRAAERALAVNTLGIKLLSVNTVFASAFGWFILAGVLIGALGSVLSLRKFLTV